MLKSAEIEAKYGTAVNTANIEALMQRDRELLRQQAEVNKAMIAAQQQAAAAQEQAVVDQLMQEQMAPQAPEGMM